MGCMVTHALIDAIMDRGFRTRPGGCLEYRGYQNELGYGQIRFGGRGAPLVRVHRAMYEHYTGLPIPAGKVVRHLCNNPSCSARDHLSLGSQAENLEDMRSSGRGYKQNWLSCPNGHPYPEDRPPASSKNRCRECARERNRRYQLKKRGTP